METRIFYCREWAFEKLKACLDKRSISATCGTLIMAESGYGKTTFCQQLIQPTGEGLQNMLSERLVAHHLCDSSDDVTLSPRRFLKTLINQLRRHPELRDLDKHLPQLAATINSEMMEDVDNFMISCIIEPLGKLEPSSQTLFILVDALDECMEGKPDAQNDTIAHLLARHHRQFPKWLALVCSCCTKVKKVTRMFTGFRKLSLDDVQKAHVIRDIQQYILHRLDREDALKQHLNRDTAEILDKLHVKSNGCLLYIELVLDMVAKGSATLTLLRNIPGTLAGLYMWICQKIFSDVQMFSQRIQPLFSILLAALRPLTKAQIYCCLKTKMPLHSESEFEADLLRARFLLSTGSNPLSTITFFHPSFRKWLQDVKFCSKTYVCNPRMGHEMISMYYTVIACTLSHKQVLDFAYHVQNCNDRPGELSLTDQAVWILMSGAKVEGSPTHCGALLDSIMTESTQLSIPSTQDIQESIKPDEPEEESLTLPALIRNGDITELHKRLGNDRGQPDTSEYHHLLMLAVEHRQPDALIELLTHGALIDSQTSEGVTALHLACVKGFTDIVELLVNENAELDLHDSNGRSPLMAASGLGYTEIVEVLLNAGSDVSKTDSAGLTALLIAAKNNQPGPTRLLLEHGADVNYCCKAKAEGDQAEDDWTGEASPLFAACHGLSRDHYDDGTSCVTILLASGASVNHQNSHSEIPLHLAASNGHMDACRILLDNQSEVDAMTSNQQTPLFYASKSGHIDILDLLIMENSDAHHIDIDGRTALGLACVSGHVNIVRRFLANGQDEMHKDNFGLDCLHLSCRYGQEKVVEILLEVGAEADTQDDLGKTPLYHATESGHTRILEVLLLNKHNPNTPAHNGRTPLVLACLHGKVVDVELLINHGANINHKDIDGISLIYLVCLEGNHEMIPLLCRSGVDVNLRDAQQRTPLHVVCWQGATDVANALLANEALVDALDCERRTPLQSAVWQGHADIVELLCDKGANFDHMCDQGATPLSIAAQEGFLDVVTALCKHGADPNYEDKFGRSAVKIAMKSGNKDLAKHIESIMRQLKPLAAPIQPHTSDDYENVTVEENITNQKRTTLNDDEDPHDYERLEESYNPEIVSPYMVNVVQPYLPPTGRKLHPPRRFSSSQLPLSPPHPPPAPSHPAPPRSCAGVSTRSPDLRTRSGVITSSSSSQDCDTAPSSVSSPHGSSISPDASDSPPNSTAPVITRISRKSSHSSEPVNMNKKISAQLAAGDHVHMANPKVNMAAKMTQLGEKSGIPHPSSLLSPMQGKTRRDYHKPVSSKMSAVKNTTRIPAYKVHYSPGIDPSVRPQLNYAVRHSELMGTNHSSASIPARPSPLTASPRAHSASLKPQFHHTPEDAAPALPPRRESPQRPLQDQVKPTLVGVVLPRSQPGSYAEPPSHSKQSSRPAVYSNTGHLKTARKETSL